MVSKNTAKALVARRVRARELNMTIVHRDNAPHLNYFLCLEADIHNLSRWIEFSSHNENVYSVELARLWMTAAQEADVIAKRICDIVAPERSAANILMYQEVLCAALPVLPKAEVEMPQYGMVFHPWSNWAKPNSPPDWWQGNNKVKHHRADHFREANLKNVLNATAGLLILLLIYYKSLQVHFIRPLDLFFPTTFAMLNGTQLLLLVPDGSKVPWA